MNLFKCLILCCLPLSVLGQEITVVAPPGKIQPNQWEQIIVRGISDEELPSATIEITPNEGVAVMPTKLWGGDHMLWFRSTKPGASYRVEVGLNKWRLGLDQTLVIWKRSKVDPALVAALEAVADKASIYPVKVGTALVEVAGTVPPPPVVVPPGPVDPDPPVVTTGKRRIFIIHETGDQSWRRGAVLTSLRDGPTAQYLTTKGHRLYILDPNAKDENNNPSPLLKPRLEHVTKNSIPLPALVIEDFDSGSILYAGKAPDPPDADKIVETIKQFGG